MKHTTYSDAFKEEALRKVLQRGRRTLGELAQELNMPAATLKGWLRTSKKTLSENAPLAEKPVIVNLPVAISKSSKPPA